MHTENIISFTQYRELYKPTARAAELLFNQPDYQAIFTRHFGAEKDSVWLAMYDQKSVIALAAFERIGEKALFCGLKPVERKELVTDYGDVLYLSMGKEAEIWKAIMGYFSDHGVTTIQLDFVREDSPTYAYFSGLHDAPVSITKVDTAPSISLPKNWESYLTSLERRDRQELKRKMNKLGREATFSLDGPRNDNEAVEELFRLLRATSAAKEKFLTPSMASFFRDLVHGKLDTWKSEIYFLRLEGTYAAGLLGFTNERTFMAYNAGFDPQYKHFSAGVLLHALVIQRCIERGYSEYDFLRGDERYKFDLGAQDRHLSRIEINMENGL